MNDFLLPDLGEGLTDAIIREWHVSVGDTVEIDQPLVTVETAKSIVEVPTPKTAKIHKLHAEVGANVQVGSILVSFSSNNVGKDSKTVVGSLSDTNEVLIENPTGIETNNVKVANKFRALPAARMFAKKHGIDISKVIPKNNISITIEDLEEYKQKNSNVNTETIENQMCLAMEKAKEYVVPATICDEANIYLWGQDTDKTVTIIHALLNAITKSPKLNGHFDNKQKKLVQLKNINLGIAMQTDNGLFAPTLTDLANNSSGDLLRNNINALKEKAKNNDFAKDDLGVPTITLSNVGTIAGQFSTPIVVPPSVAIVATGKVRDKVVPVNNEIKICPILPISISFDHRVITGGEASYFLKYFIESLEKKFSYNSEKTLEMSQ
ncbi:MAG: dihydrolipoamide acetyltransferase family protein [Pseudomonadota bacterium]|nr:dihydrolipoamide acetyltransferase family protein [Pseudomonadota bacterium]